MDDKDLDNEREKSLYELAYILEPELDEQASQQELARISSVIEKHGGATVLSESPKLRGLAYTIERSGGDKKRKFNQGYFGWMKFNIVGSILPELEKDLAHDSHIIRHLVMHATLASASPIRRVPRKITPDVPVEKASEAEIDKEVEKLIESTTVAI
ncbi:MAG TPA: 30S ribosomal protein S6 [Candidatus Paceibacterota bacterium]